MKKIFDQSSLSATCTPFPSLRNAAFKHHTELKQLAKRSRTEKVVEKPPTAGFQLLLPTFTALLAASKETKKISALLSDT